ncbi:MAG: hypothetical protein WBM35_15815, partial [Candidatus Electrothrix sp.]
RTEYDGTSEGKRLAPSQDSPTAEGAWATESLGNWKTETADNWLLEQQTVLKRQPVIKVSDLFITSPVHHIRGEPDPELASPPVKIGQRD